MFSILYNDAYPFNTKNILMKLVFSLILSFSFLALSAQGDTPELITDRPDQTESASIVPRNSLQVETGFLFENDANDLFSTQAITYNTTLLRFGLLENVELRAGLDYSSETISLNGNSFLTTYNAGLSPLYAGFKLKVTDESGWRPRIAFLGGIVFPFTAGENIRPDHSAATMRFAFAHTLSDRFSIGYNLGAEWNGESTVPGYFYSAALGIGILDKLGGFVETYGLIPEDGQAEHLLDAGFTYLVLPLLQLDISGGIGISNAAIANFVSFGLSFMI